MFFFITLIFFLIISLNFLVSIISKINLKALILIIITLIAIIIMMVLSFWGKYPIYTYTLKFLEYQFITTLNIISLVFIGAFIFLTKFLLDKKMNF